MRASCGAQHIVRGFITAGPVRSASLQASFSVAEPLCTGIIPHPLSAYEKRLATGVQRLWTHINTAFQAEQGTGKGRRHAC